MNRMAEQQHRERMIALLFYSKCVHTSSSMTTAELEELCKLNNIQI